MEIVQNFVVKEWVLKIEFNEPENMDKTSKTDDIVKAPGTGNYKIDTLKLDSVKIAPGDSLNLLVQISGENIAFLYTELYLKDKDMDYYYGPVMHEYVRSVDEKENHDLLHPVWDKEIKLSLAIVPVMRILTDSLNAAFAFMHPLGYGESGYQMEGFIIKNGSVDSNRARLKFNHSGELTDKRIILEKHGRLVTHELAIKAGDQFIPALHILTELNLNNPKRHSLHGVTNALKKLEEPFHWVDEAPLVGDYLLGLVVEDFNGDQYHHYVPFTIENK